MSRNLIRDTALSKNGSVYDFYFKLENGHVS